MHFERPITYLLELHDVGVHQASMVQDLTLHVLGDLQKGTQCTLLA